MPASVAIGPALYMDGPTYDASNMRYGDSAALTWDAASNGGGLYQQPGRMFTAPGSGMTVTAGTGTAVIPAASGSGAYRVTNTAVRTLTVATADAINPRIDLVCVGVQDNGDATSFSFVEVVTGTPAPSPSAPASPVNTVPLAHVTVAAGVTSITSGAVDTTVRQFTVAPGGILPLPAGTSGAPAGVAGQYAYDQPNDRLFQLGSAGPKQARVLPWAPQIATLSTNFDLSGSLQTVKQLTIVTDGATDIEIVCKWTGIYQNTPSNLQVQMYATIDGSPVDEIDLMCNSGDQVAVAHLGGLIFYATSAGTSDTPSAGTHTVAWRAQIGSGTGDCHIRADVTRTGYLRVKPVTL